MHWSLVRSDERCAARQIRRVGGSFTLDGPWPFFSRINSFWVRETRVTDKDVAEFGDLTSLTAAEFGYTKLTDRGIACISNYRELKYLFVWGTKITDASVETLSQMPWLRLVNVSDTGITECGFHALRDALPDCLIDHSKFGTFFREISGPKAYGQWVGKGEI